MMHLIRDIRGHSMAETLPPQDPSTPASSALSVLGLTAQIVSAHIDDPEVAHTVAAAAVAILRADLGDETAQDAVDDAEGNELSWYARQELSALLDLD